MCATERELRRFEDRAIVPGCARECQGVTSAIAHSVAHSGRTATLGRLRSPSSRDASTPRLGGVGLPPARRLALVEDGKPWILEQSSLGSPHKWATYSAERNKPRLAQSPTFPVAFWVERLGRGSEQYEDADPDLHVPTAHAFSRRDRAEQRLAPLPKTGSGMSPSP